MKRTSPSLPKIKGHTNGVSYLFILLFIIFSLPSCYHYRIASLGDPDSSTVVQKKTQLVYLWGFIQAREIKADCEGIHKVRVTTNFGYILLSAITLGTVVPQQVEWVCAAETPPVDTLSIIPPTPQNASYAK